VFAMMRIVARQWTRSWVGAGGRALHPVEAQSAAITSLV
jgi:hypothetical protein